MPIDAIVSYEDSPNHMIIWLDFHIGDPTNCIHLKQAFLTMTDPRNENPVQLIDKDYDILRREIVGSMRINFAGAWFSLAAFTDVENCIQCFEQNQHKRILFITSGSLGQIAVPRILDRFRQTFTDPETDEPYLSIYVFCHNIEYQIQWALEYSDYIQIFNHEADLLVRMIRDLADYYVIVGKRLITEDPPNNLAAYYRLNWANELYQRYKKMESVSLQKEFDEVNQLLEKVEKELNVSSDEDD